jgi:DNA-binding transcriptional LysR family regulator
VRLEPRHLRTLVAIADAGSINAAARALRLTQPALTTQLRRIESACGFPVFDRTPAGVRPTSAGRVVLSHARAVLAEARPPEPHPTGRPRSDPVRVWGDGEVIRHLLPRLARQRPETTWSVRAASAPDAEQALEAGLCDLAVVLQWPHGPAPVHGGLLRHPVASSPLRLVTAGADGALAGEPLDLGAASGEDWIVRTSPDARRAVLEECRRAGFTPRVRVEADGAPTVLALVARGLGVAVEPSTAVQHSGVRSRSYAGAAPCRWEAVARIGTRGAALLGEQLSLVLDAPGAPS